MTPIRENYVNFVLIGWLVGFVAFQVSLYYLMSMSVFFFSGNYMVLRNLSFKNNYQQMFFILSCFLTETVTTQLFLPKVNEKPLIFLFRDRFNKPVMKYSKHDERLYLETEKGFTLQS